VTICTQKGKLILGEVAEEEMVLNKYGRVVEQSWNELSSHFLNTEMDWFVVMPNHIHGIIAIDDECRGESAFGGSLLQKPKLGQMVAFFKYQTTKLINTIRSTPGMRVWQRNYYEHVIRDENNLNKIRYYIQTNPLKWHLDRENQQRVGRNMLEDEIFNSNLKK
jgi:REP element-mobilizing transposase RayT